MCIQSAIAASCVRDSCERREAKALKLAPRNDYNNNSQAPIGKHMDTKPSVVSAFCETAGEVRQLGTKSKKVFAVGLRWTYVIGPSTNPSVVSQSRQMRNILESIQSDLGSVPISNITD